MSVNQVSNLITYVDNKPGDIISGKVIYTIEDYAKDLQAFSEKLFQDKKEKTGEEKRTNLKRLFIFILFGALDKSITITSKLLSIPEDKVAEGREAFKQEIDVLRAVWMAKYIEIMKTCMVNDSVVLKLLNNEIQTFLKSSFPEDYQNDNTT